MPVYVDSAKNKYGRMFMCHMIADTLEELHDMADSIGIQRKWFQDRPKASFPHYDICQSKRDLAIQKGAVIVNNRELVMKMREYRMKDKVLKETPDGKTVYYEDKNPTKDDFSL